MPDSITTAIIVLVGVIMTAIGTVIGAGLTARTAQRAAAQQAENSLTDQLQEELARYRNLTDQRLDRLESENQEYRRFIHVQRDHMRDHGIEPPPWPDTIPR